jgi:hypothetical protein
MNIRLLKNFRYNDSFLQLESLLSLEIIALEISASEFPALYLPDNDFSYYQNKQNHRTFVTRKFWLYRRLSFGKLSHSSS